MEEKQCWPRFKISGRTQRYESRVAAQIPENVIAYVMSIKRDIIFNRINKSVDKEKIKIIMICADAQL